MITEKTIEKHRYFTSGNDDVWMLESVETIKIAHLRRLDSKRIATGPHDIAEVTLGGKGGERFLPVKLPGSDGPTPALKVAGKGPKAKTRTKSAQGGKGSGGLPSSGYQGVYVRETKKLGSRFLATVTDGGKTKRLSEHESAELAAAARAAYLGDEKEAARLRKLAEEKAAVGEFEKTDGSAAYQCSGCGADYKTQPEKCVKCMGSTFDEVPGSAQTKAEQYAATHQENCGA